jgi:hypothetical protein
MESRNKKNDQIPPQTLCFFVFYCCCALKYHAAANFCIGGRESFENGRCFLANVAVTACQGLATLHLILRGKKIQKKLPKLRK